MAGTCAALLTENGCDVRLWSPFEESGRKLKETRFNDRSIPGFALPERVEVTWSDAEALRGCRFAVSACATQYSRAVWGRLTPHCPPALPLCSVAKGIEEGTLLRPSQIVLDVLDGDPNSERPVAVLSGPCIAPEVLQKLPATVTVASDDDDLAGLVQQAFSRPYFRVYTNSDVIGAELAAATKNVIAIAAGILDGLKAGDNAKAALITRGLAEITRLGLVMGANAETFAGLAGVGDLVTTCISPIGRNRSFGEAIGMGMSVDQAVEKVHGTVEGLSSTVSVLDLAARHRIEMPITQAVRDVLQGDKTPAEAVMSLMTRPVKPE